MISYKEFDEMLIEEVKSIYRKESWNAYLKDDEKLIRAFSNSLHQPPKPEEVKTILEEAIDEYNNSKRDIKDIYRFKLRYVEIHQFYDGNGRSSRVIQNALLSNINMPRLIIRPQDKQYYYKALEDATVYGKRKEFIRFSLEYTLFMCINGLEFVKEIR